MATFVDQVAMQLTSGFPNLPRISDLETTMAVIWDAYTYGRQDKTVHAQPQ